MTEDRIGATCEIDVVREGAARKVELVPRELE
jgi:hypothetical protein